MKTTKRIARSIGKTILALLACMFMPILIWVALGVAVNQKLREKRPKRVPTPTIGEILAAAERLSLN